MRHSIYVVRIIGLPEMGISVILLSQSPSHELGGTIDTPSPADIYFRIQKGSSHKIDFLGKKPFCLQISSVSCFKLFSFGIIINCSLESSEIDTSLCFERGWEFATASIRFSVTIGWQTEFLSRLCFDVIRISKGRVDCSNRLWQIEKLICG